MPADLSPAHEPGPVAFLLLTFGDGTSCALTAEQWLALPREIADEVTHTRLISTLTQ